MKHLNRNQWIAVFAGLAFLTYLLFTDQIMNLFNFNQPLMQNTDQSQEGVKVEEVALGNGEIAEPGDTLTVHYVGTLQDGTVFDSSVARGTPITFTLGVGQVIKGWDEGVRGMREGGKRSLVISPNYAYGDQARGPIPANSTLNFQVELIKVEKPTGTQ